MTGIVDVTAAVSLVRVSQAGTHTWSHLVTSRRWTLLQTRARSATNTGVVVGRTGWDPRSEQLSAGPHDPGWPGLQLDETERQNTKSAQMSTNWETPCSKIYKDRCVRLSMYNVYLADVFLSMMSANLLTGRGKEQIYRTLRLTALFVLLTLPFNFLFPYCCAAFHEPDNW